MVDSTKIGTYETSIRTGTEQGMQVHVSGAGGSAKLSGPMTVTGQVIDHSKKYQSIVNKYKISGGVSGFWDFIGAHMEGSKEHEDVKESLHEITKNSIVTGTFQVDIQVEGTIPGFAVTASAAYVYLHVIDESGQTYHLLSSGDPARDTGAVDSDGKTDGLKVKSNNTSYIGS